MRGGELLHGVWPAPDIYTHTPVVEIDVTSCMPIINGKAAKRNFASCSRDQTEIHGVAAVECVSIDGQNCSTELLACPLFLRMRWVALQAKRKSR